ncbi:MAG: SDR family NAD(P)-dependent oxidoreductase [Deltaproteobacteria bacterium]|nr:SDR family NAD(P)-dependent oxidoreductase [Deltaproteobacteria bacterium]
METAIVAGVGPGLGASLARAFAREGYAIGLISRNAESSEPVAAILRTAGVKVLRISADVTDRRAVLQAVETINVALGPVTVLAYNASGYGRGPFLELKPETIRQSFEVSVMGAFHLAQAVLPRMLEIGHGFISLTGATASLRGRAGFAPLAIAKSSLRILGQSLAREFHPRGVHVVQVIVDGQIDRPDIRQREPARPAHTLISPDAIADSIVHTLRQPMNAWTHELDMRPHSETF